MTASHPHRRVLVVDDEPMVREVVSTYLNREGFEVDTAADGREAERLLHERAPDLVVLDLMIPRVGGLDLLRSIRREGDLPVIVLTAGGEESDRILGLELGADDYVVKPFSPRELAARVHAVLRRWDIHTSDVRMVFEGLVIDPESREVEVEGEPIDLTPKEFDLLAFLASSPRQVFTRGQLLAHVWGSSAEWQDPSTVTVHVGRIRQKIEPDPQAPRWIATAWGVGYRFLP
ncbi:MAG: response regulator transcription factor [Actinomycetota bacterium]